ncbi:MAG: lipid A export permease/ATP-binding protein MsbA [Burkholderiales bacterium]|nr:lipid A export permease/ATP-binding protein MsbA [Rhodocyclaceae bacterium]MCA3021756.1 lipid A export permease/ATP-binding protein MsbA [Rhodocyclaceae bacterium]MCA3023976.1 lipid A export permease/ATP-binding protein MsbA [Rhodocyclaceae bacterium]MCA3030762.1 lipid A export permease/ATP-binding protein MsbA [Rhodocyclaceae bacterium]MCA3036192.1 lipid A export permease/ATP-binding protein MsbA [Rhodocyclaceae bacterium]
MNQTPPTGHPSSAALYRRLLGYVFPYKWVFAGAVLAMLVGGVVEGSVALYLTKIINELFVEGNERYAAYAALGIVIIFFLSGLSHFIAGYGMQWVGNKMMLDLRNRMFENIIRLPMDGFDALSTGTLMSKVTNDVIGLQAAATTALNAVVRGFATLGMLLTTLFYLNWKLTLIMFVTVPVMALVIRAFGKRLREINRQGQFAHAAITDVLEEVIRGLRVVKIFGGEAYERKRFDAAANRIRQLNMKQSAAAAAATPLTHLVVSAAIAFIVYLAASKSLGTGMEVGEFIGFITAAGTLMTPIKALSSVNEQIQRGLASAESVFALIDAIPELDEGTKTIERARGSLTFENVSLYYANKPQPALDNVSLTIHHGETIALVGPSGGGKSSLVNLVSRFYRPTSGRITLDGIALPELKLHDLRRQMALVSQDVVLFNDTIAANIAYGREESTTHNQIIAAAKAAHCADFIEALPQSYDSIIGENGAKLSGGQRQRLAIARALLKDAPILLLDEATSALDTESERAVQTALDTLMQGRTTIVVAHRLSTVENASRIVVLDSGRIVEAGSHRDLLAANGVYAGLYRMQFAGT